MVAAVIQQPGGEFLLAQRPSGKPYAGYWEFPGGKIEPGESQLQALARELREELGIEVELAYPWVTRNFAYPHATVRLNFYRVMKWRGEPHTREHQALAWQAAQAVNVAPLLPANSLVLRALALPPVYGISNAAEAGTEIFLQQLLAALQRGLRFIQVREKQLPPDELSRFAIEAAALARSYGALVTVNGDPAMARSAAAGVHLTARRLMQLDSRPDIALCGASCHNREELERAAALELDYAVLGPVLPTLSHPEAKPLGWHAFSELIKNFPLPVYALGGLAAQDLETAWEHGAHGIAMLRGAWRD